MALPSGKNISIYKGDTYLLPIRLRSRTPTGAPGDYVDLTGCAAKAQIRSTEDSGTAVDFTVVIPDQTVTADRGKILLSLSAEQTAASSMTGGVWDVQVTYPDGVIRTYLKGTVTVIKEVTRV